MARIPDLRLIKQEDFDSKDRKLVDKLAFPINNFMQQVVNVFKNGIDFNNLNQQVVTFSVSVDATGTPVNTIQFTNNLSTKIIGMICINAINTSGAIRYPNAQLLLSFTVNANTITVNNIAGFPIPSGQTNSDTYNLTILCIGQNLPTA